MCFYIDDYDWTPSVIEIDDITVSEPTRCYDCRRKCGGVMQRTRMIEHDWCQGCSEGVDIDDRGDCRCEQGPSVGCTETIIQCLDCVAFRAVIRNVEVSRGCRRDEATPVDPLFDALPYSARDDVERYITSAERECQNLVENGYLAMVRKRML